MTDRPEWESRLGRRLRVRDLYILSVAARTGSMARAARQLAISQPAVSEAIANLEYILGVPLLDRTPRGVEPTIYADAILRRSSAVFDELEQGVRDIAFLSDPTAGELKIGCPESISSSILPAIIAHFQAQHPAVVLDVDAGTTAELVARLHGRSLDLMLARTVGGYAEDSFPDTLNAEIPGRAAARSTSPLADWRNATRRHRGGVARRWPRCPRSACASRCCRSP